MELVEAAYRWHGAGDWVNPASYFLRFPDRPSVRIIALPATLGGIVGVAGMKWISSFRDNMSAGKPRALSAIGYDEVVHSRELNIVNNFFHELCRHG